MIGLVGCAGSANVIGWIPRLLLRLVVRTQIPRSTAWWWGCRPHAAGRGNRSYPSSGLSPAVKSIFVSASNQTGLDTRSITQRWIIIGVKRGGGGSSRDSNPVGLCRSSAHWVQWNPDEPCGTWTQTCVQARISDYSLNWIKRSNAIQCIAHLKVAQPNPGVIRPRICPSPWVAVPSRGPVAKSLFVVRSTDWKSVTQCLCFWWVRAPGRIPEWLGLRWHSSKKGRLRFEDAGLGAARLTATGTRTHWTWPVYRRTRPNEVCPGCQVGFLVASCCVYIALAAAVI